MTDEQLVTMQLAQVGVRADATFLPFEPPAPNTVTTWNGRHVLWLGPDEWLVVGEPGTEGSIERDLEAAMAGEHHSVVDVGANRVGLDLIDALELLSSGCGLDLDTGHWRPGMCAQTLFGHAQVILQQLDSRTTRVFVRPSFAGYFVDRLRAARNVISAQQASALATPPWLPLG